MIIKIPSLRTYNALNLRTHWRVQRGRVKEVREATTEALYEQDWTIQPPDEHAPWDVQLTRLGPRELDDDGVVSALKPVRDALATFVGVDDKHKRLVRYSYDQRVPEPWGVEIRIMRRASLV